LNAGFSGQTGEAAAAGEGAEDVQAVRSSANISVIKNAYLFIFNTSFIIISDADRIFNIYHRPYAFAYLFGFLQAYTRKKR
jgi:hypothetical protein